MPFGVLKKAFSAFDKLPPVVKALITIVAIVAFCILLGIAASFYDSASETYASYRNNHLSPAEHLRFARELCHEVSGVFTCIEPNADQAISHLKKIPQNAPEHAESANLLSSIQSFRERREAIRQKQEQERAAAVAKQQAERNRLMNQSNDESMAQMLKNITGRAHDAFTCSTSTESLPIISFDYGHYWWVDDGRCAAQQAKQQAFWQQAQKQQERAEQQERQQAQKNRDEDAELSSYWPTTLRVDTDMDSFWLPNEERPCQTYPDANGRVSTVACNETGSHRDHNIPVKFWGGVDRDTISNWKCRRESEEFICSAID
jgi:type IV secretory pathway VirB10-like protein